MNNYPLAMSSWDQKEIEAINKVIASDMYSMGPYVKQFEDDFANYVGSSFSVMVNSGSSANLIAVASLFYKKDSPLKKGDVVIVPAVSWSTTYYPLSQYGLKLRFVDIDKETLNYDLEQLEKAICPNTRLITVVNLLGNPNDFSRIEGITKNKDIYIYEDNCESLGASFSGKQAGTFGNVGTYSTFFSHHMSTMEGGLITTDDEELYHILLSLRSHGWTRHLPKENKVTGVKSDNNFEESFKFVLPGYNLRPVEMSGAIGIEQLKKLPNFIEVRRKNAEYFLEKIKEIEWITPQKEIGNSSWFGLSLLLDQEVNRDDLVDFLQSRNIETRPIVAGNFAKNEVIKYIDHEIFGSLDNANLIDTQGLFLGNHHVDFQDRIDYLIDSLKEFSKS